MRRIFTLLVFSFLMTSYVTVFAQTFPTIYASKASGVWNSAATWETYTGNATNTPGTPGTGGVASASGPSGTHFVYIRPGHSITFGGANRNCMGMTIASGGTLTAGAAALTLKINVGGGTFIPPFNFNLDNSGTLGSALESMILEIPTTSGNATITGGGTFNLGRLRIAGGNANNPVITLDATTITFNQSANYALTAIYNPQPADNYTININAGKTVVVSNPGGYFNNNSIGSGGGFGTYTYNINGTLDLTASTQTLTNLTAISPTDGVVNLNVGAMGLIKTGAAFNSSPVAPGVANLNVAAGGLIDATLATVFNFNGNAFVTSGSAVVKRTVPGDGTVINFPVKTAGGNVTPVTLARDASSGTSAVYAASVQNGFTNAPPDPTKCVQKEWNVAITGTPSTNDVITLSWLTSDQGSNFNPLSTVTIMHYTGGAYEYKNAVVTGSGTVASPYVATASGFTSYSPFGVSNLGVAPVKLVSFTGTYNGKVTDLKWIAENQVDFSNFGLEKSTDGINFKNIHTTTANPAISNYSYADGAALNGVAYYRLRMNDLNGNFSYSNTVSVRGKSAAQIRIYPNPVSNILVAEHGTADANSIINIFSADGRLIKTLKPASSAVKTTVNVADLKPASYNVSVTVVSGTSSMSFIKQ